jgi:hypothetical protein
VRNLLASWPAHFIILAFKHAVESEPKQVTALLAEFKGSMELLADHGRTVLRKTVVPSYNSRPSPSVIPTQRRGISPGGSQDRFGVCS